MSGDLSVEETIKLVSACIEEAGINWRDGLELASLDLIVLAVRLEKKFSIEFGLDEIASQKFLTLVAIAELVMSKTPRRPSGT
ncbi:MAG: hypothetical protein J0L82_09895 [Deltaproteobacteria bacterium]|jgi:acyl carrier protein|nr:hypothetical protein [Deltaproteobacteria bacterium]